METNNITRLRKYLSGQQFAKRHELILLSGLPTVLKTSDLSPWDLTTKEVEDLLHEYAPELSATVDGSTIVLFREKKQ